MSALIPEIMLPNGMKIFYQNKEEVEFLYEEMPLYFKNGIDLYEGDTVFDVGANIGLFTLLASQLCDRNANIYAFEPIPATFEVLQRNVQRFNPEKIKVFPCGLSQNSQTVTFAFYPNSSGWSTIYPDDSKEQRDSMKKVVLDNLKDAPSFIRWLRWLPPFMRSFILDSKIDKAFQMQQVTCELRTVSQIIREHNVEQIDLLKVDVERSELDVILGIEEQDWQKIKQIVMEVHNLDNRIEKVTALLKGHGFNEIIVEQEAFLKGYENFNLYALRQKS
jgi:FkbM family methyltransferase